MIILRTIWIFLWFPFLCWSHPICIFTPPNGWQPTQPKELSKHVQIGFVGKGSGEFHPSIHLAEEVTDCTLSEYLKAVKKIHLSHPHTKWRDLGPFQMKAGTGRLTEIRNPSPYGEIVLLQAIFLQGKRAYLLTAAAQKDDLPSARNTLFSALRSLDIQPDLWSAIQNTEVRKKFLSFYTTLGHSKDPRSEWKSLQHMIQKETENLGAYWQFLAMQHGHNKIYSRWEQ